MKSYVYLLVLTFFSLNLLAQPDLTLTQIATGFTRPTDIAHDGVTANRLYIVEQAGKIKILEKSGTSWSTLATDFLNIEAVVSDADNEMGLLGLVFHPDYPDSNYFYVNYTFFESGIRYSKIARYEVPPGTPNQANAASELEIMRFAQPYSNHNAGDLSFGSLDGYLYISTGDGGSGGDPQDRAQDSLNILGKMLRIDIDHKAPGKNYAIPPTNPFVNNPNVLDEIWYIGLRNPWRFSFDRANGDLYIADVGQGLWEEVHWMAASSAGGENLGWDCLEGKHTFNNAAPACGDASQYVLPVFEYDHDAGKSITGGFVYRGSNFPSMQGYYILADYVTNKFWSLIQDQQGNWHSYQKAIHTNTTTFGEDLSGELYAARRNGVIYNVGSSGSLPVALMRFEGYAEKDKNVLFWTTAAETNSSHFEIERSSKQAYFEKIGIVKAAGQSGAPKEYAFDDLNPLPGVNYYRLKRVDQDSYTEYSTIISVGQLAGKEFQVYPNPASAALFIELPTTTTSAAQLRLLDFSGKVIREIAILSSLQPLHVDTNDLPEGMYWLEVFDNQERFSKKVVVQR